MAAPEPLRVLIATIGLRGEGGTDVYTRDLALALLRRGCLPVVYTTLPGALSDQLRDATIPVVSRLDGIGARPDVIHGQHHFETLAALARFPGVPALFVCHDSLTWHSIPPKSPRIGMYVAVDRNCRDRMIFEHGVAEDAIRVLANPVDLRRYPRRDVLAEKPSRALIFSNAAKPDGWSAAIRAACDERGITVDTIGLGSNSWTDRPEDALRRYDLVFGKARCALEAIASGAAVIVCDARGLASMVTASDVDPMRALNFGARTLQRPITRESILREIDRYDADEAMRVSEMIRAAADVDLLAEQFDALYDELLANPHPVTPEEDLLALSASIDNVLPKLYEMPARGPLRAFLSRLRRRKFLGAPVRALIRLARRAGL